MKHSGGLSRRINFSENVFKCLHRSKLQVACQLRYNKLLVYYGGSYLIGRRIQDLFCLARPFGGNQFVYDIIALRFLFDKEK